MYEAKSKGKNCTQFFTEALFEKRNQSIDLERALRQAVLAPDQHFELHYQPRMDLQSGSVASVETLIRWNNQRFEDVPTQRIIELAEQLGLIEAIDEWVLNEACKKIAQWGADAGDIRVSINISGRTFNKTDLLEALLKRNLEQYRIGRDRLEIEITEHILLTDSEQVNRQMQALKRLGVRIAIDDFGTGFSSLSYLNRFPIDTLKIDGSFTCDQNSDENAKALLKAIISIGEALGLRVVAECVETEAQKAYLTELNCDEAQGFYWGKPSANWAPNLITTTLSQAQP